MSKEVLAIEWLSEYLGRPISIDELGYESYVFEGEELDGTLIPPDCVSYFKPNEQVLTDLYAYGNTMVYFFQPLNPESFNVILIGLLDNFQLIDYKVIKGDIYHV